MRYCSHPTGVPVTASGHLKSSFGEGPDARQPLLLWPDTVQRSARCRVNSNESVADRKKGPIFFF